MNRGRSIAVSVVALIVILTVALSYYLMRGLDRGAELELASVDISGLEDGEYMGSYQGGRWSNQVKVIVEDSRIVDIEIIDDVSLSRDGVWLETRDMVIDKQSLDIDGVTGATVTSKSYLKAIEDALASGN